VNADCSRILLEKILLGKIDWIWANWLDLSRIQGKFGQKWANLIGFSSGKFN